MKPLDFVLLAVSVLLVMSMATDTSAKYNQVRDDAQLEFKGLFESAVDDTGAYLALLEAQQTQNGVRYSREKQISLDMDMLTVFFQNLALKFGIEGDSITIQNLMMHIPAMAMVRYDGYNLIVIDDTTTSDGQKSFTPVVQPIRPFTYKLPSGVIVYFTLDDWITLYDPNTNQYFQGEYEDMAYIRDLSPMTDYTKFKEVRSRVVTRSVSKDLEGAINRHIQLISRLGIAISITVPEGLDQQSIQDVGFFAFVQGYPLPGGETLTTFAFGGGSVAQRDEYIGVIQGSGRHVAYSEKCVIPEGSLVVERLFNDEEAARKGYFIQDCIK